jgi:uncharacterized protein involved in exopolysaccharide biosynthesis
MSQDQQKTSTSEASYRVGSVWTDLFAKLKGLKSQGKQILVTGLVCAVLGLGYSFLNKPVYLARVNFVIEENKQNAGGLFSALAGQVGMDLSSLSGMSGILSGDNVLELLKSPTLLKKVLLIPYPGDSLNTLAYRYAQAYGKLDKYNKLVGGDFREPASKRVGDSLITAISTRIIEKELSVYKPDRKLSVFRLDLTTRDELLSQTIATRLIDQAANLYIETKTRRLKLNVDRLQKKSDSIAALLNYRTEASVSKDIINQNPSYVRTEVDVEISNREKNMLSIIYGDVNKSLDVTRTALIQETPTIEIIDTPDLPLKKTEIKWYFASALGFLIGVILFVMFIFWFKPLKV